LLLLDRLFHQSASKDSITSMAEISRIFGIFAHNQAIKKPGLSLRHRIYFRTVTPSGQVRVEQGIMINPQNMKPEFTVI
jgi:hypothetical protein